MATTEEQGELAKTMERNLGMILRAVETSQTRLMMRVLRYTGPIRKRMSPATLMAHVSRLAPPTAEAAAAAAEASKEASSPLWDLLLEHLGKLEPGVAAPAPETAPEEPEGADEEKEATPMDEDEAQASSSGGKEESEAAARKKKKKTKTKTKEWAPAPAEVETYLASLAIALLCRESAFDSACAVSTAAVARLREWLDRRTLDPLSSKVYFLYAHAHEVVGRSAEIRAALFANHRTAVLRHNELGQAVLLNTLLRSLLQSNCVEAAYKLVTKTEFPENASNNQFCRYLYYTGRISALRLDYTDAHQKLLQSNRKAPANTAPGFRRAVAKLTVLVQLLMGELPDRATFEGPELKTALAPYLDLTRAVRRGSLADFTALLTRARATFAKDRTETLVVRLSQNVVKTGLRRLNTSYSRISLEDIREALQLDSVRSAEFVAAKAIADGLIDATLDHDAKSLSSKDDQDLYASSEPQKAFHRRIAFCLDVHNEAVKAMMYPDPKKITLQDDADAAGKRDEDKTAEEVAKEIEDELAEEDD